MEPYKRNERGILRKNTNKIIQQLFKQKMETDKKQLLIVEQFAIRLYEKGLLIGNGDWMQDVLEEFKIAEKERMIEFGELVWRNLLRSDKIMRPRDVYTEKFERGER